MAAPDKPELSNGYTRIASAILENLATVRLSGREWNVLMVILRQTYGWNRKEAVITLSEFAEFTGLAQSHISMALGILAEKGVIKSVAQGKSRVYGFQKYLNQWKAGPRKHPRREKITLTENGKQHPQHLPKTVSITLTENGTKHLPKTVSILQSNIDMKDTVRKSAKPPVPGVHELITAYTEGYEKRYHRKPIVSWGQWGKEFKLWLADHDVEYLTKVVGRFLGSDDPWIVSCAHSLGALKARINAIMNEMDSKAGDDEELEALRRASNERYAEDQEFELAAAERRSRTSDTRIGDDEQGCAAGVAP